MSALPAARQTNRPHRPARRILIDVVRGWPSCQGCGRTQRHIERGEHAITPKSHFAKLVPSRAGHGGACVPHPDASASTRQLFSPSPRRLATRGIRWAPASDLAGVPRRLAHDPPVEL